MKYYKNDVEDDNKHINYRSVTSMVTDGENMRYKDYIRHVEAATTLAFMSKREIYKKLINKKVRGRCMRLVVDKREG